MRVTFTKDKFRTDDIVKEYDINFKINKKEADKYPALVTSCYVATVDQDDPKNIKGYLGSIKFNKEFDTEWLLFENSITDGVEVGRTLKEAKANVKKLLERDSYY